MKISLILVTTLLAVGCVKKSHARKHAHPAPSAHMGCTPDTENKIKFDKDSQKYQKCVQGNWVNAPHPETEQSQKLATTNPSSGTIAVQPTKSPTGTKKAMNHNELDKKLQILSQKKKKQYQQRTFWCRPSENKEQAYSCTAPNIMSH